MRNKQDIGLIGEDRVKALLMGPSYQRSVIRCPYKCPYDLVIDGLRTEVKCAAPRKDGEYGIAWQFNIHRHGMLSEDTDIYILRLEKVPYSGCAMHMLLAAPIGKLTVLVSMRSLLNQEWAEAVSDFYALAKGEYGKKKIEVAA